VTPPRVVLPPLPGPVEELWDVILDLSEQLTAPWTLIGGQMVLLHALEHRRTPGANSQDGDVLANIRASQQALLGVVALLERLGFELEAMTPDGIAHRYRRASDPRPVIIDVLAPDNVGERASLLTSPPGRTVQVPGGTQALARTEWVDVVHRDRTVAVPRPSLLGAIVGKAAACGLPSDNSRHVRDLALLLSLVDDPFELAPELTKGDRRTVRAASALDDDEHEAWRVLGADHARDGRTARSVLLGG
jgi:hypothetical protein